jgi:hypothetical protein
MGASAILAAIIILMEPLGRRMSQKKNTDNLDNPENQEMMEFTEQN